MTKLIILLRIDLARTSDLERLRWSEINFQSDYSNVESIDPRNGGVKARHQLVSFRRGSKSTITRGIQLFAQWLLYASGQQELTAHGLNQMLQQCFGYEASARSGVCDLLNLRRSLWAL